MKVTSYSIAEASAIALQYITFLASDEARIDRFAALSGMGLNDLKSAVDNPVFLGFVLDYALQDESLLVEFSSAHDFSPQTLVLARRSLPGANDGF